MNRPAIHCRAIFSFSFMLAANLSRTEEFMPACASPFVAACAGALLSEVLQHRLVSRVEISDEDIARIKALENERVVITPNHPTNTDPALVFKLSRRAGIPFHYLCCREAFDGWNGLWGKVIQRLGAYSVVRGTIDRESFRYSRELLAKPKSKLVIFPEGEVYSQNESLLPFQVGAIQLALWGLEEARKTEPNAEIFLLPIGLRYRFAEDVRPELERKIKRMESKLKLPLLEQSDVTNNLYGRMRRIAVAVLSAVEEEYSLDEKAETEKTETDDLTPRFMAAKEARLARAASLLDVKQMPKGTLPERMRVLLHRAEEELHETDEESTPFAIAKQRRDRILLAWRDLERLANWIAVYDGYAAQNPSPERIAEVVFRLENDVCGNATYAGPRVATIKVGEPIKLPEKIARSEMPQWTQKLENAVAALL